MKKLLIAAVASTAFISSTALAQSATDSVDFEVNEVFVQTPGPGAGARLMPQAEV